MRYLDPKNDLTFYKVFGEHPDLAKSLLNALMPFSEGRYIESLEYLSPEQRPDIPMLKNSIVDVKCEDNFGRQFVIEMQMFWTESFTARVIFNASKAYVRQLGRGIKYKQLQPVYALNFVNDTYTDSKDFYHHYSIVNVADTKERLKGLEFVFIELPKFRPTTILEKKVAVLWLRFLTEIRDGAESVPDELLTDEHVAKAVEVLRESAFNRAELEAYDRYWDIISTERTLIDEKSEKALENGLKKGLEKGLEKGLAEGLEKGLQQGREMGLQQGREMGLQQGQEMGEMRMLKKLVIKMHQKGQPIALIQELTGLEPAQIQDIISEMGNMENG